VLETLFAKGDATAIIDVHAKPLRVCVFEIVDFWEINNTLRIDAIFNKQFTDFDIYRKISNFIQKLYLVGRRQARLSVILGKENTARCIVARL
jgi:hypothetical protein